MSALPAVVIQCLSSVVSAFPCHRLWFDKSFLHRQLSSHFLGGLPSEISRREFQLLKQGDEMLLLAWDPFIEHIWVLHQYRLDGKQHISKYFFLISSHFYRQIGENDSPFCRPSTSTSNTCKQRQLVFGCNSVKWLR